MLESFIKYAKNFHAKKIRRNTILCYHLIIRNSFLANREMFRFITCTFMLISRYIFTIHFFLTRIYGTIISIVDSFLFLLRLLHYKIQLLSEVFTFSIYNLPVDPKEKRLLSQYRKIVCLRCENKYNLRHPFHFVAN